MVSAARSLPAVSIAAFEGNILSYEEAKQWARETNPDVILHLAAVVPTEKVSREPALARRVNSMGPARFAEAVMAGCTGPAPHFVFTSTSHVYQSSEEPIDETGLVSPQNIYGETKLAGEQNLAKIQDENQRFRLLIARVFSVFSEDQAESFLLRSLQRKLAAAAPSRVLHIPGWDHTRDFLHASQAARLLLDLAMAKSSGVVNVGSGSGKTILDFASHYFQTNIEVKGPPKSQNPSSLVANIRLLRETLGHSRVEEILGEAHYCVSQKPQHHKGKDL